MSYGSVVARASARVVCERCGGNLQPNIFGSFDFGNHVLCIVRGYFITKQTKGRYDSTDLRVWNTSVFHTDNQNVGKKVPAGF
jgi:hypothetical protein